MITTSVTEAAACLQQGQVLAYPTEAVWGLGCDPYNQQAFLEILRLKQRPIEKGVILLAGHHDFSWCGGLAFAVVDIWQNG